LIVSARSKLSEEASSYGFYSGKAVVAPRAGDTLPAESTVLTGLGETSVEPRRFLFDPAVPTRLAGEVLALASTGVPDFNFKVLYSNKHN
jgi:hypothetical protein